MDCPHCKLVNPPGAKRCDCGYDFETQTIEKSYLRQTVPKDVKTGFVVIVLFNLALAVLALISGEPERLLAAAAWGMLAYFLYRQLVLRKDWARKWLALITFPFGTAFFLSADMKLYCQQQDEPENSE